jgi:CheY-like chemotaxis protein
LWRLAVRRNRETHAARAMPRRVMRPGLAVTETDRPPGQIEFVDRRQRVHRQAEHLALLDGALVQEQIVAMQIDRHVQDPLRGWHAGDMIHVRVCEQDVSDRERPALGERKQTCHLVARIDEHGFTGALARHDEAVLEERCDGLRLDYDHQMILAVLDDLMFTSKIKTTATPLGLAVVFARSSAAALSEMRKARPALVIFDLNNPRTDPLGTVRAMKSDPALASIPTLGFVSHVQTDLIDAARQAGVGEVLARSAFAGGLAQILVDGENG